MLVQFWEIEFEMLVGLQVWYDGEIFFALLSIMFTYLNALQYDNTLFPCTLLSRLK